MKIIRIIFGLIACVSFGNLAQAGTNSTSEQTTATLSATCTISAQNLNFGALALPISAQSATSSMSVLCSKAHAYTVGLAYGGVYGTGSTNGQKGDYWTYAGDNAYGYYYYEYSSSGTYVGSVQCYPSGGVATTGGVSNTTCTNGVPTGWTGSPSASGNQTLYVSYTYGMMTGASSGDNVAYQITVPGNSSQIWNAGENTYSSTGTGSAQSIPINGLLVPAQTTNNYPTPDSYLDTVTATVTF
jgi:spore coat protein U-like protein